MAIAVLQRVGPDRNRQRLLCGVGRPRVALSRQHARDVDLERDHGDVTIDGRADAQGAAATGGDQIGFADVRLRERRVETTKKHNHEGHEEHEVKQQLCPFVPFMSFVVNIVFVSVTASQPGLASWPALHGISFSPSV